MLNFHENKITEMCLIFQFINVYVNCLWRTFITIIKPNRCLKLSMKPKQLH